jgi:phosphoglycolate phosphatase
LKYSNIIFDLDGTLVDSSPGIIKCMHYAFDTLEIDRRPAEAISKVIGPPLHVMISMLLDTDDSALIQEAVLHFRNRYRQYGIVELNLYLGVIELIDELKNSGKTLSICTSKPQIFAEQILNNFGIFDSFTNIIGSLETSQDNSKNQLLSKVIHLGNYELNDTVMIGDRAEDADAAHENNIESIGVTYGYGEYADLENANCAFIFDSIEDLKQAFTNDLIPAKQW